MRRRILLAFEAAEREQNPEKLQAWMTFVIVGAGPTGAELAGALGEIAHDTLRHDFRDIDPSRTRIVLVEGTDRPLPTYPPKLSEAARKMLVRLGVTVRTGAMVTDIRADGVTIREGDRTENIPTRTVLWAAGVLASPLGRILSEEAGAKLDKRRPGDRRTGHDRCRTSGNIRHRRLRKFQPSNRKTASRSRAARNSARKLRGKINSRAFSGRNTSAISLFR